MLGYFSSGAVQSLFDSDIADAVCVCRGAGFAAAVAIVRLSARASQLDPIQGLRYE
jgi:hypothetical protein